jgi:hypothetical protein
MTKEDAKKVARDIFARYPNEKKVFVTSDGQAFFREMHAKNHANGNRAGKELKIEEVLRNDVAEKNEKAAKDKAVKPEVEKTARS